jgi:hypothetical protein
MNFWAVRRTPQAVHEPNYVELVWAVRRITPGTRSKYIRMFYGDRITAPHARPATLRFDSGLGP